MAPVWVIALLVGLLALSGPPAPPSQAEMRRDITFGSRATQFFAKAHTEVSVVRPPATFRLTLDPGVLLDGSPRYVRGLTEAYVSIQSSRSVFSIGIERLPLEVARLTLPFSIERVDALGTRLGRPGMRWLWYPDDATRVRFAVLDLHGRLEPLVSVRRQFASFEVEAHALHYHGRTVYGIGGSGLLGDLVVYGEVWSLGAPQGWRYALGTSGRLGRGIWTVEGGYTSEAPGFPHRHQLAAQAAWPVSEDLSMTFTGRVFFDAGVRRYQIVLQSVKVAGNVEFTGYVGGLFGPSSPSLLVGGAVRISY